MIARESQRQCPPRSLPAAPEGGTRSTCAPSRLPPPRLQHPGLSPTARTSLVLKLRAPPSALVDPAAMLGARKLALDSRWVACRVSISKQCI